MAQSMTKNSLGNAIVILLLCRKAGLEDFTNERMVQPSMTLDAAWIADHPKNAAQAQVDRDAKERPVDCARPSVPLA